MKKVKLVSKESFVTAKKTGADLKNIFNKKYLVYINSLEKRIINKEKDD